MECILDLRPKNKKYKSFREIYGELSEEGLWQLESMCNSGVTRENQTFHMNLSIHPDILERHNYDLSIQLVINGAVVQYVVENAMTRELNDSTVEFMVVNSVSKEVIE